MRFDYTWRLSLVIINRGDAGNGQGARRSLTTLSMAHNALCKSYIRRNIYIMDTHDFRFIIFLSGELSKRSA
jgi:hypothetical protein